MSISLASEPGAGAAAPLVSVVVRTKDRPALLRRALASLAAQTYRPLEAVVINDGGCDLDETSLRAALAGVALVYVRLATCGGRAHAANAGVAAAHGPLIAFLDDDDELLPNHVSTLAGALAAGAGALVYSDCEIVDRELDADGRVIREESRGRYFMSRDFSLAELQFENFIPLLCVLASRDGIETAGGFDEALDLFEDWDLFLRVASRAGVRHVPEITARYIQWSSVQQIAFSGGSAARDAFLRTLAKHWGAVTPEAVHEFVSLVHGERKAHHEKIRELELRALVAERLERESERLRAEIERRDRALERLREGGAGELAHLRARLAEATAALHSVTRSRAWRLVESYRSFKRRLLPAGTRRHRLYSRLLRTGDSLPHQETGSGEPQRGAAHQVVREQFLPPPTAAVAEALAAKVSVVIPTLNAGSELRAVLERLRSQRVLPKLEIIAVDSGSTDGTLALCERHGVTVVPYPGGAFNHGVARNAGAAAAGGEFLVFMSQDVIPVGSDAVAGLVRALHSDPLLAAVSARQLPRSDADLFTCWQLWAYREKVLGYSSDTVVSVDPQQLATLTPEQRRRAAQVDNVFACVRRQAFDGLRFRPLAIAEDLDLGLRLLARGHRIGFMSSVAAVHSHNRPPAYHLRRSFMEWRAMVELVGFATRRWDSYGIGSTRSAVRAAGHLYRRVGLAVPALPVGRCRPADLVAGVRAAVEQSTHRGDAARDVSIEAALDPLSDSGPAAELADGGARPSPFVEVYGNILASFGEYLEAAGFDGGPGPDLRLALFKICGETIGSCLADFGAWGRLRGQEPEGFAAVSAALAQGV